MCDRCSEPVSHPYLIVNGRPRHLHCWPIMAKHPEDWDNFLKAQRDLARNEAMMISLQCCSRSTYEKLVRTKNVGLAIASNDFKELGACASGH